MRAAGGLEGGSEEVGPLLPEGVDYNVADAGADGGVHDGAGVAEDQDVDGLCLGMFKGVVPGGERIVRSARAA